MNDLEQKLAKAVEKAMWDTLIGGTKRTRQTVLRLSGRSFEVVEIDDFGNTIEPPPRCCYGTVLHTPNCKMNWMT